MILVMDDNKNVEPTQEQELGRGRKAKAAQIPASGPNAGENPFNPLPTLYHNPTYTDNWNGVPRLVRPFSADEKTEKDAVDRIFKRLGSLRLLRRDDSNHGREDIASNVDVAKGLIRRLLGAQIYFIGKDHKHNGKEVTGYTTGLKLLDPNESTFNAEFFSKLFSGIMAETQLYVPHYVYVINFCDKLLQSMRCQFGVASGVNIPDPDFTVSLFSLNDVLKNICEESAHQFDASTSSAFGWLNIWLLGVQKNLICKRIPSEQHLKMFRNGVAHNQFDMTLNYMQLFNKRQNSPKDDEASASGGDGAINWMSQIVLGDLVEVNMVLKMLHNSGYILNVSRDQENMNRRSKTVVPDQVVQQLEDMQELQFTFPELDSETLQNVYAQMEGDVEQATKFLKSDVGS